MTKMNLDSVLADDDWLRRIARRLIGDADAADDLAQEAWLAAHQSGRGSEASRPWLAGVLRNSGRRMFRTRTRQRDLAASIAQDSDRSTPATDELVESLQLRERAARELLALEEPFRRALYLVYVTDLSISAAAREEGVALSTMSERVRRGLERLRVRLDDAYGGERRAWAGALLPLSGQEATPAGAAVAMGWTALALAIGAALVVVPRVWKSPGEEVAPAIQDATLARPSDDGTEALAQIAAPVGARAAAQDSGTGDVDDSARLVGRFLLPNGEPANGARWWLSAWSRNADAVRAFGGLGDWENLSGVLSEEGELDLAFEPPLSAQFSLAVAESDVGRAGWRWTSLPADATTDLGTTRLHPVGVVTGRVLHPNGEPVVGRQLNVAVSLPTVHDPGGRHVGTLNADVDRADGTFRVANVPAGPIRVQVSFRGGLVHRRALVTVPPGDEIHVDVLADRLAEVASRVLVAVRTADQDAFLPLDASSVRLIDGSGHSVPADEFEPTWSRYEFRDLEGGPYTVRLEHPGFEAWEKSGVTPGDRVFAKVRGSGSIQLEVTDSSGASLAIEAVELEAIVDGVASSRRGARTADALGPDGVVPGVIPGDWRLTVRASGQSRTFDVLGLGAGEARSVNVALVADGVVRGRCFWKDGSPVQGVDVRLCSPAEVDDSPTSFVADSPTSTSAPETARHVVDRAASTADGRFELRAFEPGPYRVIARVPGSRQVESALLDVRSGSTIDQVDLALARGGSVEGAVEFPEHFEPEDWSFVLKVDGVRDWLHASLEPQALQPDGSFSVERIPAGTASLVLIAPRDERGRPGPEFHVATFELAPGESVTRSFAWPDPAPLLLTIELDVPTELTPPRSARLTNEALLQPLPGGPCSGERGIGWTVGPLVIEPLDYGIRVVGEDWVFVDPLFLAATSGVATRTVTIDVESRRLRVLSAGQPQPEVDVVVCEEGEWYGLKTFETDADGWVEIGLSPGTFQVRLRESILALPWPPPIGRTELDFD
ncbi:MAG: sigma factor [Planctomycetota bacterium]